MDAGNSYKMKLLETYNTALTEDMDGKDIEVWECDRCGRTFHIEVGGDICACLCEFENEGRETENPVETEKNVSDFERLKFKIMGEDNCSTKECLEMLDDYLDAYDKLSIFDKTIWVKQAEIETKDMRGRLIGTRWITIENPIAGIPENFHKKTGNVRWREMLPLNRIKTFKKVKFVIEDLK